VTEILAPTIAPPGQPCAACGSPLAGDQRYCLVCGERRPEARLPFRDVLATPASSAPALPPAPDGRAASRANTTLVAGVGCLLLALGIGVLIGRAGRGTTAKVPPAQVIRIQGASAPAAAAAAPTSTTPTKTTPSKHHAAAGASHSTNKKIQNLQNLSTNAYQKKSQKLPKTVGTGGKPPPKDKKPAAGGGGFQNIG